MEAPQPTGKPNVILGSSLEVREHHGQLDKERGRGQTTYVNGLREMSQMGTLLNQRYFFTLAMKLSKTYTFSSPGDRAGWAFET